MKTKMHLSRLINVRPLYFLLRDTSLLANRSKIAGRNSVRLTQICRPDCYAHSNFQAVQIRCHIWSHCVSSNDWAHRLFDQPYAKAALCFCNADRLWTVFKSTNVGRLLQEHVNCCGDSYQFALSQGKDMCYMQQDLQESAAVRTQLKFQVDGFHKELRVQSHQLAHANDKLLSLQNQTSKEMKLMNRHEEQACEARVIAANERLVTMELELSQVTDLAERKKSKPCFQNKI